MSNRPDFVQAKTRAEAVQRMIASDKQLRRLYSTGPNNDGKGGWVNMIRDQHGGAYRLLFYLDRIPISKTFTHLEPYEVVFGQIDSNREDPNFPRALYTTTGAVNLSRDGIPGDDFIRLLNLNMFVIEPLSQERDLRVSTLWERGLVYVCVYAKETESLRILDLRKYLEIYFVKERAEVQVRNEEDIIVGDMTDVKPFTLRMATSKDTKTTPGDARESAEEILQRQRSS